jgi:SAM-dependent methyltransferase
MGISLAGAEFLVRCRQEGVNFGRTLTLGRQQLFVSPFQLERLLKRCGCWPDGLRRQAFLDGLTASPYYADPFLRALGAEQVSVLDASAYEGADIVHDLGLPIPSDLQRSFDLVIDGGLLEHVFNFPAALKNAMELVRVGGHLILITPANNYFGHGFYQFSPELFFRALSPENGFTVERMLALESDLEFATLLGMTYVSELKGRWYEVSDPASLGMRVTLTNKRPVLLFIRARCQASVPVFAQYPQQSDYVASWESSRHSPSPIQAPSQPPVDERSPLTRLLRLHLKFHLLSTIMRPLKPFHRARFYRAQAFRNRVFFRTVKPASRPA